MHGLDIGLDQSPPHPTHLLSSSLRAVDTRKRFTSRRDRLHSQAHSKGSWNAARMPQLNQTRSRMATANTFPAAYRAMWK